MGFSEHFRRISPFDEQFSSVHTLEFGEEKLSSIDVSPELTRGNPILFIPGWNARIPDYKKAIELLVAAGRRVVSIEPIGSEEEKADELLSLIELKGLENVDLIAHSVGSISASLAALQIPGKVRHLVLLNPPMNENDPRNLIRKYKEMLNFENAKNIADVGGRKIFEMARVISTFDTNSVRERLTGIGTKVASIHGLSDILFLPPANVVSIEQSENGVDDQFIIEGNHLQVDSFIPYVLRWLDA